MYARNRCPLDANVVKFTHETSVVFYSHIELCIPDKYFINTIMLHWCRYRVPIEPIA